MQSLYLNGKKIDGSVLRRRSKKLEVDWFAAEELLLKEASIRFPEIAAKYPDEEFYGVFFDCDVVNTCVQAHMNTNALLRQYAMECQQSKWSTVLGLGHPLYPGLSIDEIMEELRWDGGGWKHFGVFAGPKFEEIADAYDRLQSEIALREDFMIMACRAVVRMERSGVFECIRRTQDFRVFCVYVNEPVEEAERRLKRVRRMLK
jgi:Domain of unknown function (DUF4303)